MRKARRLTANQDKEDGAMKKYENPTLEVVEFEKSDLITCSFGNLPELDGEGTETPVVGFNW